MQDNHNDLEFSGFSSEPLPSEKGQDHRLLDYVQSLHPETIAKLSKPDSVETRYLMERNVIGLLGGLPSEGFDVNITTSRESLGRLLASAMMSGDFLHNVEQRFAMEDAIAQQFESSSEATAGSTPEPWLPILDDEIAKSTERPTDPNV